MIHAYDKIYLDKARTMLARMLDFAVYDLEYDIADFFSMFIKSEWAERFEKGESSVIAGKSGVELAYDVVEQVSGITVRKKPNYAGNRSGEYWTGWALAYYQWETSLKFAEIEKYIPIKEITKLYIPYHEMDIRQFADKITELYKTAKSETNLKLMRRRAGLNQKELSEQSGIPLRTIQQYEQGQKNINKAAAENIISLSKVLLCNPEDLLELVIINRPAAADAFIYGTIDPRDGTGGIPVPDK